MNYLTLLFAILTPFATASAATCTLSVDVTADDAPLQGATVFVQQRDGYDSVAMFQALTDAQGRAQFTELADGGDFQITGQHPERVLTAGGRQSCETGTPLSASMDLKLAYTWIRGRITDPDGNPVAASVSIVQQGEKDQLPHPVYTQAASDGTYTIGVVGDERYVVYARVPEYRFGSFSLREVRHRADRRADIQLSPPTTIHGMVLDSAGEPVEGATIGAYFWTGDPVKSKADGTFSISTVAWRHESVSAHMGNHVGVTYLGDVDLGESRRDVVVRLQEGRTVTGRVTNADNGGPVNADTVAWYNMQSGLHIEVPVADDGTFTATGVVKQYMLPVDERWADVRSEFNMPDEQPEVRFVASGEDITFGSVVLRGGENAIELPVHVEDDTPE